MKKQVIVLLLLSGLFNACAPAAAPALPTARLSPERKANPARISVETFTPLPTATPAQSRLPDPENTPGSPPGKTLKIERVAQIGGNINGITVLGDVAYVGIGPRLAAIDISQHQQPQFLMQSRPLQGLVTQVLQISSASAPRLLVNAGKHLLVMDISDPDELKPIDQLELAGAISALVWDDRADILYAGGSIYEHPNQYTGFISAVGITEDNQSKIINTVPIPEPPQSLALGEECLFAGAPGYQGGLYHIQVKTPGELSTPDLVVASVPERPLQPLSMRVIGERLYLSYMGMEVYDITNPEQPVQIWTAGSRMVGRGFSLAGEQIYIFGWAPTSPYTPQLDTIPVPEPIAGSPIGQIASVTAMHNGDFLVAYHDLEIYDAASPQALQLVGSFQAPVGNVIGAVANDKAAFVVDNGAGDGRSHAVLQVLSLPDLKPLGQITTEIPNSWDWVIGDLQGLALDGDRLYLASADNVWVYDVSRAQPNLLDMLEISGGQLQTIVALKRAEKRLLVFSQEISQSSVLTTYDLTDLQKPVQLGNPLKLDSGSISQMAWNGSALYALLQKLYEPGALLYLTEFDNNDLVLKESLEVSGYVENIAAHSNLAALAGMDEQLTRSFIFAVEPEPLKLLSQTALPEQGKGVAILEDRALVVVGHEYGAAQLVAFDFQGPSNPNQVMAMDIAVSELHMVPILVAGSYVVLANGSGGVEVLDYGH